MLLIIERQLNYNMTNKKYMTKIIIWAAKSMSVHVSAFNSLSLILVYKQFNYFLV